jgi:hypothetical protein
VAVSPCPHGLGVFFWKRRTRGIEMMEVCANGFVDHRRGYFISKGSASGVMTGWRALMGIPNDEGFFLGCEGFFHQTVFMAPDKGFSADSMPRIKSLYVFG